jgi:hypothetical protein
MELHSLRGQELGTRKGRGKGRLVKFLEKWQRKSEEAAPR